MIFGDFKKIFGVLIAVFAVWAANAEGPYLLDVGAPRHRLIYYANHELQKNDPEIEYAVIFIHGASGGGYDVADALRQKLAATPEGKKVFLIAPSFYTEKTCRNREHRSVSLIWKGNWRGGGCSVNGNRISSFEIADRIVSRLADRASYPNLRHILICGFSAGGQFVNRYVAVAELPTSSHVELSFAVGAPSIYLYIDGRRKSGGTFEVPSETVRDYDSWYYGLEDRYAYAEKIGKEVILKNLSERYTLYLCGTNDTSRKSLKSTPAAMMQGENRIDRFSIYRDYVSLFPEWQARTKFIAVPGLGHSREIFYRSRDFMDLVFGKRNR